MLQAARTVNKDLVVMAELFTSSAELDAIFVQKLGINILIRELQNETDTHKLGNYIKYVTCQETKIGTIDDTFIDTNDKSYKVLKPRKPEDILYDQTHDNLAIVQKFKTGRQALPLLGLISMLDKPIASNWGYDYLMHEKINCIKETRQYQIDKDISKKTKLSRVQSTRKVQDEIDFTYEFNIQWDLAKKVSVAGEFNSWKPDFYLKKNEEGIWKGTKKLEIDRTKEFYSYKFVIDETNWTVNHNEPKTWDHGGNENNIVHIPKVGAEITEEVEGPQGSTNYPNLCELRKILNEVHQECNENHAEIDIYQPIEEVLVTTR